MSSYDVIIIGGGAIGSSIAYHLADADPDLHILVVERDWSYATSSTALSWAGIRQQFSTPESIEMSAYGMAFYREVPTRLAIDGRSPDLAYRENGYLLLHGHETESQARANFELQRSHDAPVRWLATNELAEQFPEVNTDGIAAASFGYRDEGWIDPMSLLSALKAKARQLGVEYVKDEVIDLVMSETTVTGVRLANGETPSAQWVVNAAGTHAAHVAKMAGVHLPIRPQRLVTFVFDCQDDINHAPLTVDVSGVAFRPEGNGFIGFYPPQEEDNPWRFEFDIDYSVFEEKLWPVIAHRLPRFEAIKMRSAWAGHLAYNDFDCNAFIGKCPGVEGFLLANGFSGHGLQHCAATGRAIMELVCHGRYQSLDLSRLSLQRLIDNRPIHESVTPGASSAA